MPQPDVPSDSFGFRRDRNYVVGFLTRLAAGCGLSVVLSSSVRAYATGEVPGGTLLFCAVPQSVEKFSKNLCIAKKALSAFLHAELSRSKYILHRRLPKKMRFSLVYLALGLASAAYAAPFTARSPRLVTVTFHDRFAGATLPAPTSDLQLHPNVKSALDRVMKKYGPGGPHEFQYTNEFEDADDKGFSVAMTGFKPCKDGYSCVFSVLYDETKNPVQIALLPSV
ncbi:hypothetical protein F5876DRAFT_82118 [Lentinula aff. lateritia]|uniref:Uncharacterized protein n=1 Tax=Lentinula aff. lateritia TaxID=2804960 RepID=A0ACC1TKL8_9AGAR|nr:hypothetical protein F5876DRAFT_82118 [Lentinula aff. lateritia]